MQCSHRPDTYPILNLSLCKSRFCAPNCFKPAQSMSSFSVRRCPSRASTPTHTTSATQETPNRICLRPTVTTYSNHLRQSRFSSIVSFPSAWNSLPVDLRDSGSVFWLSDIDSRRICLTPLVIYRLSCPFDSYFCIVLKPNLILIIVAHHLHLYVHFSMLA